MFDQYSQPIPQQIHTLPLQIEEILKRLQVQGKVDDEIAKKICNLSPKPYRVLILLLEKKTDDEIAGAINTAPATVRKHIQNLCDHFGIAVEVDGQKRTRREILVDLVKPYKHELVSERVPASLSDLNDARGKLAFSSVLPFKNSSDTSYQAGNSDKFVSDFYGRTTELTNLRKWIVDDKYRLLVLLGMGGIGKSTLALKLKEQLQSDFKVHWLSLRDIPPPNCYQLRALINCLQMDRYLLVLDDVEWILEEHQHNHAGYCREEYKEYMLLLKYVMLDPDNKSCLVLISREKPKEIEDWEGEKLPVRSLQLKGLMKMEEAREIFKAQGLVEEENSWKQLVDFYGGNPLILNIVSATIRDLFNKKTSEFIKQETLVFGGIGDLLIQPFSRLSDSEKEILYWLAIEGKPVSLPTLQADILLPIPSRELLETLRSLRWRALIETKTDGNETLFLLQRVVEEYVISKFIEQVSKEIIDRLLKKPQEYENTKLLLSHSIIKVQTQNGNDEEIQRQPILNQILNMVRINVRSDSRIEAQLEKVIKLLKEQMKLDESTLPTIKKFSLELGYIVPNVFYLYRAAVKYRNQPLSVFLPEFD